MFLLSERYGLLPNKIGKDSYTKHLNALNTCNGSDSPEKDGIESYIKSFLSLNDEIVTTGKFDTEKSIVPITSQGVLIDGSHRLSIALAADIQLPALKLPVRMAPTQPLKHLKERYGLNKEEYLLALRTYLRYQPNAKIIILFPRRDKSKDEYILKIIARV